MKLVSGSFLVALISTAAWAAAPEPAAAPAPAARTVPSTEARIAALPVPSAERLALARQVVDLTITQQKAADSFRAFEMEAATSYATAFYDAGDNAEIQAAVYRVLNKLEPTLQSQMPQVLDAYARAYAREFSADELKTMIAFAESLAGKHFLSQPDVLNNDWGVVGARQRVSNSMVPTLQEMEKDACAKRAAMRVAAGDAKATCPLAKAAETQAG
jgi:hypothetical protein